jgi:hypothetical protein
VNVKNQREQAQPKVISQQEAIAALETIDKKLKGKKNGLLVFLFLFLISVAANVAQFLHLI